MEHSFNIYIAKKYGVNAAVLLKNIYFWIEKNRANETNCYDGHYWTYNSKKAFADLFPYMTARQVDYALQKLIDEGIIITGNYNKLAYDRTLWYAITKKGYCILQNCATDETKTGNGAPEIEQPIPDTKPVIKPTDSKPVVKDKGARFEKPTLEEIRAYCAERKNSVDPEHFYDYYEANGWRVGKNAMKDWKASVRTWERNGYDKPKTAAKPTGGIMDDFRRMQEKIDNGGLFD